MNYKINEKYCLTTESPASHHGIPVVIDLEGHTYGPSNSMISLPYKNGSFLEVFTFDGMVWRWANKEERTDEERKAASLFLGQWPQGLQLDE